MLTNCLATSTHLSSTVSQLFEPQVQKIAVFTYRSPHFSCPWRRPCDYHAICCMNGTKIQCLPNSSQHVPIYRQQFPSYTMLKWMCKSKNRYFLPHFGFPWGRPWGNHAKCCTDGKRIRCLQIVSQHVPSIFNNFPVIRTASAKSRRFHVPQPTFLYFLETFLRISRNMLQGWKENSMLAKPLAACTYLSSIVSELYDA